MDWRNRISTISLLVVLGGGTFLTTSPSAAADAPAYDCRESVRAYCQYVADNYCTSGATCWYNTSTCHILSAECLEEPE
jgi:hypothetical protein